MKKLGLELMWKRNYMDNIYTIGFTQKTAETFFNLLKSYKIELLLDIRLNNTSQLASFTKFPDIKYFLKELCGIEYIHDTNFSPLATTLKHFKNKDIDWQQYKEEFYITMDKRNIDEYIKEQYNINKNIILLCSEVKSIYCHRSLVAKYFKEIFDMNIIDL